MKTEKKTTKRELKAKLEHAQYQLGYWNRALDYYLDKPTLTAYDYRQMQRVSIHKRQWEEEVKRLESALKKIEMNLELVNGKSK
jgi:hypothetical protein